MFDAIYNNKDLLAIIRSGCYENGYEASIAEELRDSNRVLILKIDAYFNSKNMHNPPPSIDCLVIVKCDASDCYNIHLIELKNISSPKGFNKENIVSKFKTTIDTFLKNKFATIFLNQTYCNFKCYFVTNPYRVQSDDEYITKGLKLDYFTSIEPFEFGGRYTPIEPMEPKLPNPTITPC